MKNKPVAGIVKRKPTAGIHKIKPIKNKDGTAVRRKPSKRGRK